MTETEIKIKGKEVMKEMAEENGKEMQSNELIWKIMEIIKEDMIVKVEDVNKNLQCGKGTRGV